MTARREQLQIDELEALANTIEFLTENGFSILRACDQDHVPPQASATYTFLIQRENDYQREVVVTIDRPLIVEVNFRTCGQIDGSSSFWVSTAERHLALFLWEKDDYPDGNKLRVDQLDPDEIISAMHWGNKDQS